jgi:hypothetical protein
VKKHSKKKKYIPRNLYAVAAFQRSGGGKHQTRDQDVSKGRSRKRKHKGEAYDI